MPRMVPVVAVAFDEGHVDGIAGAHADEGARAVKWVDQPHPRPGLAFGVWGASAFFADDGNAQGSEAVGEDAVARVVGIGDRGAVALVLHLQLGVGQPRQFGGCGAHHAQAWSSVYRRSRGDSGRGAPAMVQGKSGQGDENGGGANMDGRLVSSRTQGADWLVIPSNLRVMPGRKRSTARAVGSGHRIPAWPQL